jgi:hypothetical protein
MFREGPVGLRSTYESCGESGALSAESVRRSSRHSQFVRTASFGTETSLSARRRRRHARKLTTGLPADLFRPFRVR